MFEIYHLIIISKNQIENHCFMHWTSIIKVARLHDSMPLYLKLHKITSFQGLCVRTTFVSLRNLTNHYVNISGYDVQAGNGKRQIVTCVHCASLKLMKTIMSSSTVDVRQQHGIHSCAEHCQQRERDRERDKGITCYVDIANASIIAVLLALFAA